MMIVLLIILLLGVVLGVRLWQRDVRSSDANQIIPRGVPHWLHVLSKSKLRLLGFYIFAMEILLLPVILILLFCWYLEIQGSYIP